MTSRGPNLSAARSGSSVHAAKPAATSDAQKCTNGSRHGPLAFPRAEVTERTHLCRQKAETKPLASLRGRLATLGPRRTPRARSSTVDRRRLPIRAQVANRPTTAGCPRMHRNAQKRPPTAVAERTHLCRYTTETKPSMPNGARPAGGLRFTSLPRVSGDFSTLPSPARLRLADTI